MRYFFILTTLFCSKTIFSQNELQKNIYFSDEKVTISLFPYDCINTKKGTAIQYFFIEIENKTSEEVSVSFKKELWFNDKCQTCNSNSNEYVVEQIISPHEKIVGDCNSEENDLKIFSKMLNLDKVRKLTKYELKDIKIENIK